MQHNHLHVNKQNLDSLVRWKNNSGETVPAFGVVEAESYVAETNTYVIRKPTSDGKLWFANGPVPVEDQASGASYLWHIPQQVLCSLTEPDAGEGLGPESGSWEMGLGSEVKFLAWINEEDGIASAIAKGGAGEEIGGFAIVQPTGEPVPGIGFTCDAAEATIITTSCRSRFAPGDVIYIWDLCRNWLNMPVELLVQTTFNVQYVKIHEPEYDRPPSLTGDCRWVVTGMCCVESSVYEY